jgi:hypothetical protein
MTQKHLNVGELIELLSQYDKNKLVYYYELEYGTTPVIGVSEIGERIYIDCAS